MELPFKAVVPMIGSMFVVKSPHNSTIRYGKIIGLTKFTIITENSNKQIEKFEYNSYFWDNVDIIMNSDEFEELLFEGEDITDEDQ